MTAPNEPPTRYLSVHELAARWGEHPNTVYARVRTPEWLDAVRTIQLGRQLRFLEADVDAYDEAHRLTPESISAVLGEEPPAAARDEAPAVAPATEFGPRRPSPRRRAA